MGGEIKWAVPDSENPKPIFQFTSPLQKFTNSTKVKMGKDHPARKTLQEYSEWSTVHGIAYVFASSLPFADRILWGLLVFTGIVNCIFFQRNCAK